MNRKAAMAAVVLIPLLAIGTGVFVAARRSSATMAAPAKAGPSRIGAWLSEGQAKSVVASEAPEHAVTVPIDRAQIRHQFVTRLERYRFVGRRSAECKVLWPEASTEEEGRALQREKVLLDAEWAKLSGELTDLAAKNPEMIAELVRSARELPERVRLAGLIAPEVDAEITSEDSSSGPLLSDILTLATGDAEDRMHLASFFGQLTRANRDIGIKLLDLMKDPDANVRLNASHALTGLVLARQMKQLLAEETAALQQLSLLDQGPMDSHTRGSALIALASLGTEQGDDWVLYRFESSPTLEHFNIWAMNMVASRIVERNPARLTIAMRNAVERAQGSSLADLRYLANLLPEAAQAEFKRAFDGKVAQSYRDNSRMLPGLAPRGVAQRSMTGVTRFSVD